MVGAAIAGVSAVGSLASGAMQASSASKAAKAQENAANSASQVQEHMFDTTQANLQPYMQSGYAANNALLNLLGITPPASNTQNLNLPPGVGAPPSGFSVISGDDYAKLVSQSA